MSQGFQVKRRGETKWVKQVVRDGKPVPGLFNWVDDPKKATVYPTEAEAKTVAEATVARVEKVT